MIHIHHRALVLAALAKRIKPGITHFGKRCASVVSPPDGGRAVVHFTDGTNVDADVVIGADGIKSTVRQATLPENDQSDHVSFSGTVAYRGLVPTAVARAAGVTSEFPMGMNCFIGKDKVRLLGLYTGFQTHFRIFTVAYYCQSNSRRSTGMHKLSLEEEKTNLLL